MNPMTAKEFLKLEKRDFENGAVRDAIYIALKEREKPIEEKPEITEELIEEKARELFEKGILYHKDTENQAILPLDWCKDFIRKLYDEMPAKKSRVDTDWIELKAWWLIERIEGECGELKELQRIGIYHLLTEKGDLTDILTEAGVEVKE